MWTDPDLYELENADDPVIDLAFWEALVRATAPRRMLEPACGTGRVTLLLEGAGLSVVGRYGDRAPGSSGSRRYLWVAG